MKPHEIRAALVLAQVKPYHIACKVGKSPALVQLVITGTRTNPMIRAEIASAIGKPVAEIWPDKTAA